MRAQPKFHDLQIKIRAALWRWFLRTARAGVWAADEWIHRQERAIRAEASKAGYLATVDPAASALREQNRSNGSGLYLQPSGREGRNESNDGEHQQENNSERIGVSDMGGNYGEWIALRGHGQPRGNGRRESNGATDRTAAHDERASDRNGKRPRSHGRGTATADSRSPRRRMTAGDFDRVLTDRMIAARAARD